MSKCLLHYVYGYGCGLLLISKLFSLIQILGFFYSGGALIVSGGGVDHGGLGRHGGPTTTTSTTADEPLRDLKQSPFAWLIMIYFFLPYVCINIVALIYLIYKMIKWLLLKIEVISCKASEEEVSDLPPPPTATAAVESYNPLLAPLRDRVVRPVRIILLYYSNVLLDLLRRPAGVDISSQQELTDVIVLKDKTALYYPPSPD